MYGGIRTVMHNHDQGLVSDCRWCQLDALLHELAAETSASNLDSYLRTEMNSIWNAEQRREAVDPFAEET